MKNSSRKAKGRYLQNIVKQKIMDLYPALTSDDIRTSMMSETGQMLNLLQPWPVNCFHSIECKNRQDFKQLYNYWSQTKPF